MPIPVNPSLQPSDSALSKLGVQFVITGEGSFTTLAGGIGAIIFIAAIIAMFICIFWSALQWMLSGADQSKLQAARSRIINCLIGLAIVSLAWAFIILIQYFFGLEVFET